MPVRQPPLDPVEHVNPENHTQMAQRNWLPVPDPTVLTTQQLQREISILRELLETRLIGIDKAVVLLQVVADKHPNIVEDAIQRLRELHDEKFRSIATQFIERDSRIEHANKETKEALSSSIRQLQQFQEERFNSIDIQFKERDIRTDKMAEATKIAVDAALQAAKEAVAEQNRSSALAIAKSEVATMKQIDQQGVLIQTNTKIGDDKNADLKERLTLIEGRSKGSGENIGHVFGAIGLVVAVVTAVAAIIALLIRH